MENQNKSEQPISLFQLGQSLIIRELESRVETIIQQRDDVSIEYEDLDVRHDQLKALFKTQEDTIARQQKQLKNLNKQLEQMPGLTNLAMMAESIFMGNSNKKELDYLKSLYHARFNGLYIPKVEQILTGDYSMEDTNPVKE
ncbi:MAG TPA: hypothetical protein VGB63_08630 [Pedobacter sp.]|jgi:transcriptional regulator with AAA-type ATPase domain